VVPPAVGSSLFSRFHPKFPPLANSSFPDQSGRQIRCTSFGQALYSLPGGKLNPSDASQWMRCSVALTAQLKVDLTELSALSKQVVPGVDEEDDAVIAEADRVRLEAIAAIDEFLQ
jgi:hypothetical protein